jgi:hypothetical protein
MKNQVIASYAGSPDEINSYMFGRIFEATGETGLVKELDKTADEKWSDWCGRAAKHLQDLLDEPSFGQPYKEDL